MAAMSFFHRRLFFWSYRVRRPFRLALFDEPCHHPSLRKLGPPSRRGPGLPEQAPSVYAINFVKGLPYPVCVGRPVYFVLGLGDFSLKKDAHGETGQHPAVQQRAQFFQTTNVAPRRQCQETLHPIPAGRQKPNIRLTAATRTGPPLVNEKKPTAPASTARIYPAVALARAGHFVANPHSTPDMLGKG